MNSTTKMMDGGKKKLSLSFFDLLVILYFLHKLLPWFGYIMPGVVFLGLFGLLMIASFTSLGTTKEFRFNKVGSLLLMFLSAFLGCIQYINSGAVMSVPIYLYGELQVLLFGLAIFAYDAPKSQYKKKYLFYFILLCYVLTAITTIIGNIRYPTASRILATTDSASSSFFSAQNIGGFSFTYELVLITPLLIYMFKKNVINRWVVLAAILLFGYTIIKTEYATALLVFFLTLILFCIPNLTTKKIFAMLILCVAIFLISSSYIADLLQRLSQSMTSETVAIRFQEIAAFLKGTDTGDISSAVNRSELYQRSINTLINTSFLGSWSNVGLGGHSFILDTMGRYGIIGILAMVVMYRIIYTLFIKPHKSQTFFSYLMYVYLVSIVLAFLNPKTNVFIFLAVFPLFANMIEEKKIKQKEASDEILVDRE